ncbi:transporter [Bacillus pseudomycoides]|uniref:Transporter n=2 Tax=Bacillus pseudomycoides TaxID=64104 RepID=A0A2A8C3A1_9BACI|nr:transporter [Bacillus pseudomycoides]PED69472.1 transporter [Bacillus pseudomycoides]PEI33034.1 transporter [Bacillus pseudomycoides]PEJ81510.1 transporter [Bacillus pseudomycoides]PEM11664.1 transporter [Bacillus pseudomycoides]
MIVMNSLSNKEADKGAIVSIIAYIFLSSLKIVISYIALSSALRADGLNNLTDIGASLAVLIGLKISRKPRDPDHPYGHSRAEQIASLVASFIMATVGLEVIVSAIQSFFNPQKTAPNVLAAWVALFCAVVMYVVYKYNNKIAQRTKSKALEAAAKDNLSDALVSIGTVIGIVASQFHLPILDPIAALIVGLIICKTAWDIFTEASHMLTDGIDPDKMEEYSQAVRLVSGVEHIVDIRARMYGNQTYVDITIEVDAHMDVSKSHHITDTIEEMLERKFGILHTHIHVEPMQKEPMMT